MKKLFFGLGLLLGGVIGFVGWVIACISRVEPGACSVVWGCLRGTRSTPVALYPGYYKRIAGQSHFGKKRFVPTGKEVHADTVTYMERRMQYAGMKQ